MSEEDIEYVYQRKEQPVPTEGFLDFRAKVSRPPEEEVEDGGATGIEIKDDGNGSARKGAERIGENKEWQKSFEYFVGRA